MKRSAILIVLASAIAFPALAAKGKKAESDAAPAASTPAAEASPADGTATPSPIARVTPTPPKNFPGKALEYLPVLVDQVADAWPDLQMRSVMAAQIEQETCISLKGKSCWNPKTELKTDREYGFGLGQITIAYNKDGTERFNVFNDLKKLDAKLKAWKFEDRYDPGLQIRALVLMDKDLYHKIRFDTADETEKLAFMFSAYNGGLGGILQDRQLCKPEDGCDRSKWFGNVAKNSFKSKIKAKGYSISFFDTNRCYSRNILVNRRAKYAPFTFGELDKTMDPSIGDKPWMDGEKGAEALTTPTPTPAPGT